MDPQKPLVPLNSIHTTQQSFGRKTQQYQVAKSDTAVGIALKFGMTLSELLKINRLLSARDVYCGQKLLVYAPEETHGECHRTRERKNSEGTNKNVTSATTSSSFSSSTTNVSMPQKRDRGTSHADRQHGTTHSLPLLLMLRKQRNHHYIDSSTNISSSPSLGIRQTNRKLSASPSSSHRPDSFQRLMQQLKENQRDILRENVRFLVNTQFVSGMLTVTPHRLIFEPDLDDPMVLRYGILACQFTEEMSNLMNCEINEASKSSSPLNTPSPSQGFLDTGSALPCLTLTFKKRRVHFLVNSVSIETLYKALRTWMEVPTTCALDGNDIEIDGVIESFKSLPTVRNKKESSISIDESFVQVPSDETSDSSQEETTPHLIGQSVILKPEDTKKLKDSLPLRLQMKDWILLYSTAKHGISFHTFYSRVYDKGPNILVIEDSKNYVFGAFVSEYWKPSRGYYGAGQSFLFTLYPEWNVYQWTGINDYVMYSTENEIALGGGGGTFGLWIDSDFLYGSSGYCETFMNNCLASTTDFKCTVVECWGFHESHKPLDSSPPKKKSILDIV
jgi:LysM repeat protein